MATQSKTIEKLKIAFCVKDLEGVQIPHDDTVVITTNITSI